MNLCLSRRFFLGTAISLPMLRALQRLASPVPDVTSLLDGTGMVPMPAGQFSMGSTMGNPDELPVRRVRISRAFEIAKYPVTQAQWEGVMRNAHMSPDVKTNPSNFAGMDLPVESVTWDDAQLFLHRLSERSETHLFRLPTEAEWEYTASAGFAGTLADSAWFELNSGKQTHPVGQKKPNKRGLYDMFGNVAEWVGDWYGRDYDVSQTTDPQGPVTGSYRVYRGGCWFDPAKNMRAAYRGFDLPANKAYSVGFRVVRVPKG